MTGRIKCKNGINLATLGIVCFSLGVLLSFFLPVFVLIIIEALLALVAGLFRLI